MAALVRHKISESASGVATAGAASSVATVKAGPRLANASDVARRAPVHDQRMMLESAFGEPAYEPLPGPMKLVVLIGAPVAMWAGVIFSAAQVLRIFHP